MTVDELKGLEVKAKTRKDGVYKWRSNYWAVKSGRFVAYIDSTGQCLQRLGAFNVVIGNLWQTERYEWKKYLDQWLAEQDAEG